MGTQVLRPYDCLTHRNRLSPAAFYHRKTYYGYGNGIPKVNRKPVIRQDRPEQIRRSPVQKLPLQGRRSPEYRQRSPEPLTKSKRSASTDDLRYKQLQNNNNNNDDNLVHGKVTILRRGESLGSLAKAAEKKKNVTEELAVYGAERLGPDPETVMKQVRVGLTDVYAGSAAAMSPSPRALPLPSFFKKVGEECAEDSGTKDLRRLLRLD